MTASTFQMSRLREGKGLLQATQRTLSFPRLWEQLGRREGESTRVSGGPWRASWLS